MLFFSILIVSLSESTETTKVRTNAKPQSSKLRPAKAEVLKSAVINSVKNPPMIIGTLKRKLYSADLVSSFPINKRLAMVVPERDNPGNTAKPCVMPTTIADLYDISGGEIVALFCLNV